MLALACVVILDPFQRGRQDGLVGGEINRALFKIDVQPVKAISFHQADNFIGQRLLLTAMQFDVCIGATERNQHRPPLTVKHADLTAELGIGDVDRLEGRNTAALHEGHRDHVVFPGYILQSDAGKPALPITVAQARWPVVPKAHEDFFAGNARHQRSRITRCVLHQ